MRWKFPEMKTAETESDHLAPECGVTRGDMEFRHCGIGWLTKTDGMYGIGYTGLSATVGYNKLHNIVQPEISWWTNRAVGILHLGVTVAQMTNKEQETSIVVLPRIGVHFFWLKAFYSHTNNKLTNKDIKGLNEGQQTVSISIPVYKF